MTLAHLTLPTQHVEQTIAFFEKTLGYTRRPAPGNSPVEALWLDIGRGQQIHVVHVDGLVPPPSEGEFGRHVAVFYPRAEFAGLRDRLAALGAELIEPLRATPFQRFFFRDPVNGYVFEVIEERSTEA
jgi:catechol 2,3-dioxygenase-like lactoylglutathione lyase family enzyme